MDTWKHGTFIDLWSLVHLLSGILLGVLFYAFGFSLSGSLLYASLLLIAWELYEWLIGILEPSVNVAVDLAIGLFGLGLSAYWHYGLGMPFDYRITGTLGFLLMGLSVWGFIDFVRRGYR